MKSIELTLLELLLVISIVAVLLYLAERSRSPSEKYPNMDFAADRLFHPFEKIGTNFVDRAYTGSDVGNEVTIATFRTAIEERIESSGWQVVTEKTLRVDTELVHFDRWIIKKDDTIGCVTLFYANEAIWPNLTLFNELRSKNRVEMFAEFWIEP